MNKQSVDHGPSLAWSVGALTLIANKSSSTFFFPTWVKVGFLSLANKRVLMNPWSKALCTWMESWDELNSTGKIFQIIASLRGWSKLDTSLWVRTDKRSPRICISTWPEGLGKLFFLIPPPLTLPPTTQHPAHSVHSHDVHTPTAAWISPAWKVRKAKKTVYMWPPPSWQWDCFCYWLPG